MRYAVIMAGGAGRRLWPLSRQSRPKQLLPLLGGRNLLQLAVDRLAGLFAKENIRIITSEAHAADIRGLLGDLPPENVGGEPQGRDTASAIALASELLAARDDSATMAVFTADHVIRPQEQFAEAVGKACETAEAHPESLVTFGVRPTWPHTGLGYIHCGQPRDDGVRNVIAFKEKPEHRLARMYIDSGRHFWNSGMFVWTLAAIRSAMTEFLPETMRLLQPVGQAARQGADLADLLAGIYPSLEKISIDYAVMERAAQARKVLMVELNCEWLDVGSWPALEKVAEPDEAGNTVIAPNTVLLDSSHNVIVCEDDHLIALVGIDDCVVVRSDDATLICTRSDSLQLKKLVPLLEEKHGRRFL